MAFFDTSWYCNYGNGTSTGYYAVTVRPQNTAVAAGVIRRQFTAPAVGSERAFVCIVAGTTANVTDATWVTTRGAKTTDGTATWQECTGQPSVNGDTSGTTLSSAVRSLAVTLGQIVKNNSATHYFIASTAGTPGASEPTYNTTAGATTTDGTCTWTSLGAVGSFSAWGAPHARLANAYASNWGAPGNKFWLADNHAETQSTGMTLTNPASATLPTYTICVDRTAALPPVEANYNTGATISMTAASNMVLTLGAGPGMSAYYQGITFSAGAGSTVSAFIFQGATGNNIFKNCAFVLATTSIAAVIHVGNTSGVPCAVFWDNCTVQFGNASQTIKPNVVSFEWRNTASAIAGTIPTYLFTASSAVSPYFICRGVDFSAFSGTLVNFGCTTPIVFEDCKFHPSVTRYPPMSGIGYSANPLITVRCDRGATNYNATRDEYAGAQTVETSITRVGGATDGTTATSDKIVTNAQATLLTPCRMLPLTIWNDITGADVTVTVYGLTDSASLPRNDEIWMDVQYLGSSGSPIASFKSTSKTHPLAVNAAVTSDSSIWNGTPSSPAAPGTEAAAFLVRTSGLDATHTNAYAVLINGLVADGIWAKLDVLHVYNTQNATTANLNLLGNIYNATPTNAPTFTADQGYTGASSGTKYVGTGFTPSTATSPKFTQNSAHVSIWSLTDGVTGSALIMGCTGSGTAVTGMHARYTGDVSHFYVNSTTDVGAANSSSIGHFLANRSSSSATQGYKNGVLLANETSNTSVAVNTREIFVVGQNQNGTPLGSPYQAAMASIGSSLSQADVSNFYSRLQTYMGLIASGGVWTPFKLVVTLTSPQPQMKGYIYINVRAAKASTTYYLDPKVALS